jgi:surface protein
MFNIPNLTELNELIPKRIKGQSMPTDILPHIHSYLPTLTDKNIRKVIHSYFSEDATLNLKTRSQYGNISNWDVSNVTDMMSKLFLSYENFNEDISNWDVSNVTHMNGLFCGALTFNQDISGWNVRKVEFMHRMFMNAELFNYDVIGAWRSIVAEDLETDGMFEDADTFCSEKYVCGQSNLNPFSEFNSY